jgi:hypothetical protein
MPKAIIVIRQRTNNLLNVIKHQHALREKAEDKTAGARGKKITKPGVKPKVSKKRGRKTGKRKVL